MTNNNNNAPVVDLNDMSRTINQAELQAIEGPNYGMAVALAGVREHAAALVQAQKKLEIERLEAETNDLRRHLQSAPRKLPTLPKKQPLPPVQERRRTRVIQAGSSSSRQSQVDDDDDSDATDNDDIWTLKHPAELRKVARPSNPAPYEYRASHSRINHAQESASQGVPTFNNGVDSNDGTAVVNDHDQAGPSTNDQMLGVAPVQHLDPSRDSVVSPCNEQTQVMLDHDIWGTTGLEEGLRAEPDEDAWKEWVNWDY